MRQEVRSCRVSQGLTYADLGIPRSRPETNLLPPLFVSLGGYTRRSLRRTMASEEAEGGKNAMDGILLMAGTIVVEGGLVYLLLKLVTEGARGEEREEEARRRLKALEAEEERLRKAA